MDGTSDRGYVERTLRDSEPFARFALDSLSANIAVLDESGTIVFVNDAWREFARANEAYGSVAEDANYLQVCESAVLAGSDEAATFAEGIRLVLSGRRDEFTLEYPCHSPTEQRWFVGRVTRFPSGGPARAVVAHENVTERKRAERERARLLNREQVARAEAETTRQRLRAILDNLTEGVLVSEPQGRVVFVNQVANAMLGSTNGKTFEELPDLWEDFHLPGAVGRCAQNGESIEARVSHGESYLRVRLECLVNDERRDVLVVMQDLSDGHRLEANQQRFLANAAHELKTPLMAVIGAAELLATGEDANLTMRRRLLDHIFSEGRRMQRLADALLRLSRVGWDTREPNQEVVNLRVAGQRAAELAEPLVESAGLTCNIEGESTHVSADAEWLQEVLLVLLSNAIKHSTRGGGIRLRSGDGAVTVEDEGAGISAVDLPHVFERFYQGKGSSEGFGLGLPICKELIERMGGSISVRSREGIGTTVKVELPKADLYAQDTDSRG